ncbi:MAG: stage II sporulation protein R [Provencibacterium sp.]|jgi:stage II sporulation protein R|nr:stage II sporulation protein R [Provencibacterium sp.]
MKLYKWELALLIGLFFAIGSGSLAAFAQDCGALRDSVLRLHILANSDQPFDQQIKLEVRDAILEEFGEELASVSEKEGAEALSSELLPQMEETARRVVRANGYSYPVQARIVRMYFETRTYGRITMPAGMYDAVRITIGEAQGHNWWCVLYPPVCVYSASAPVQELCSDAVAGENPRYEPRFKVVEWLEEVKAVFAKEGQEKELEVDNPRQTR